jgi:hypothetical protein
MGALSTSIINIKVVIMKASIAFVTLSTRTGRSALKLAGGKKIALEATEQRDETVILGVTNSAAPPVSTS